MLRHFLFKFYPVCLRILAPPDLAYRYIPNADDTLVCLEPHPVMQV